ncbi:MAG: hypothetical protein ACRC7N_20965 [Clostridium sp.]
MIYLAIGGLGALTLGALYLFSGEPKISKDFKTLIKERVDKTQINTQVIRECDFAHLPDTIRRIF